MNPEDQNQQTPTPGEQDPNAGSPTFPNIGEPVEETTEEGERFFGDFKSREEAEAGFTELSGKVDTLTQRLEAAEADKQSQRDTINRLISSAPQTQTHPATPTGVNVSDRIKTLPDAVEKPQDFAQAVGDLVNDIVESRLSVTSTETGNQQLADSLWNDFQGNEKFKDVTKFPRIIRDAAIEESRAIAQTGGDIYHAMRMDPSGYQERVANRARNIMKELGINPSADAGGGNNGGQPAGANGGQNQGAAAGGNGGGQQQVNRTGGIPGGNNGGGGTGAGGSKKSSLVDDLNKDREKNGFY